MNKADQQIEDLIRQAIEAASPGIDEHSKDYKGIRSGILCGMLLSVYLMEKTGHNFPAYAAAIKRMADAAAKE